MSESAPVGALRAFARSKPTEFDAFLAKWLEENPQEEEQPNDTIIDDNDTWIPDSDTETIGEALIEPVGAVNDDSTKEEE